MTRSRWFNGANVPWEPGVYEREFLSGVYYAEWTGRQWLCSRNTLAKAVREREVSEHQTNRRWRGLAKDPKS